MRNGCVRLVLLVLMSLGPLPACSRQEAPVQRPEGFVDVLDTIGRLCADTANSYECAKAVEQYRLAKGVQGVSRVGKRLSLALKNGTVLDLTDTLDPGADDYVAYTYTEFLACFGYHLVHRQLQETETYLLVQADTGARIDVAGVPILAPDCGRMAMVSGLPSDASLLQIWRWNDNGRATLEWGYQPESPWTPGIVVWKNTTQLSVPYTTEDDPGTKRTFVARLYTDGWRVEP